MVRWKQSSQKGNPRVKNTVKISSHGIVWDSSLELYMYNLLISHGHRVERQHVFELIPGFRAFDSKWIRPVTWRCDFWLPELNVIIDTKGFPTEIFRMKYKLFRLAVYQGRITAPRVVHFPSNQSQCLLVVTMCDQVWKSLFKE